VAVTLVHREGYFRQKLDEGNRQQEFPDDWKPEDRLRLLPERISVEIEGRAVLVQAWSYRITGMTGYDVPIVMLDTDIEENSEYDREITDSLYGGDKRYRLAQEVVLGIGGRRMLKELGYHRLNRFHMNEGHSSLLALELLRERGPDEHSQWDIDAVRRMCVFTTHTPVPAGHDRFPYDLVSKVLGDFVPMELLRQVGGEEGLNMTRLALRLSRYVNGVAKLHGKLSEEMFPGYHIDSITNGVHAATWVGENLVSLFDKYMLGWSNDPSSLRYALAIPKDEIWRAHRDAKAKLISFVNETTGSDLGVEPLTIGFARRATAYKRPGLVLFDKERLARISSDIGNIQILFAGKAHPMDEEGKALISEVIADLSTLHDRVEAVYLEDYDTLLAKMLVSGVDLWLNTPKKPHEASGTSGMKAALNGVPSLSIADGWWIEGCIEGVTGWAIGSPTEKESVDADNAASLYHKLEEVIVPMYYRDLDRWTDIMRHCIAINGSFFNTHRMVQQYVLNAYL
jgi:starch phosphorylase